MRNKLGIPGAEYHIIGKGGGRIHIETILNGARVWLNTSLEEAVARKGCRLHIEGWIPVDPRVEELRVPAGIEADSIVDVFLAPYGNTSMGITLYPYLRLDNGSLILVRPGVSPVEVEKPWYYPGAPNYTVLAGDAWKTRQIEKYYFLATGAVFAIIIYMYIKKKILRKTR